MGREGLGRDPADVSGGAGDHDPHATLTGAPRGGGEWIEGRTLRFVPPRGRPSPLCRLSESLVQGFVGVQGLLGTERGQRPIPGRPSHPASPLGIVEQCGDGCREPRRRRVRRSARSRRAGRLRGARRPESPRRDDRGAPPRGPPPEVSSQREGMMTNVDPLTAADASGTRPGKSTRPAMPRSAARPSRLRAPGHRPPGRAGTGKPIRHARECGQGDVESLVRHVAAEAQRARRRERQGRRRHCRRFEAAVDHRGLGAHLGGNPQDRLPLCGREAHDPARGTQRLAQDGVTPGRLVRERRVRGEQPRHGRRPRCAQVEEQARADRVRVDELRGERGPELGEPAAGSRRCGRRRAGRSPPGTAGGGRGSHRARPRRPARAVPCR